MKHEYLKLALTVGLIFVFSPAALARSASACKSARTATEASCLLTRMKDQAMRVRQVSDKLIGQDHNAWDNFWQYDASTLQRAWTDVNQMDHTLYRLRTLQATCSTSEKRAINLLVPSVVELNDTTQSAINYLNQNHLALMFPAYKQDAQVMYSKANRVVTFVKEYQDYVLERVRARELKSDLGVVS